MHPGMSPEEFRRAGRELVDWIADYWEDVENLPIQSSVKPGEIRRQLPDAAPESPEAWEMIMADVESIVMPGLTHWQSPNWHAFFPGNVSRPGVLGELLSAGLGQQGMLWASSPVATELEAHMLDWLVDLLGLPQTWKTTSTGGGVIQTTASDSTHAALIAARELAGGHGLGTMVAYTSSQAHSSTEKGAKVAGFGHVKLIDVDSNFAMVPEALTAAIANDRAAGLTPVYVGSSIGTTGTTAVDPIRRIGEISRSERLWHHVDAAYAGSAMICPEFRHHQDGLELADSYVVNPHKWLAVNLDCSVLYLADRKPLLDAMSILPPYLRNEASEGGEVIDYRDWHVSLGRRFRALKLWFVLRSYGAEGLRTMIRNHVAMADGLAKHLDADERFEIFAPHPFGLVCFRHAGGDDATRSLASAVNETGEVHWTASEVNGRPYIRAVVGQTWTEQRHVDKLWEIIDTLAGSI